MLKPGKDLFTFLLFLLRSGFFWLLAALNETYESEVYIPVSITGVPQTIALDEGEEDTIQAVIRDKGFIIMAYRLQGVQPIEVDFDKYKRNTGRVVVGNAEVRKLVSGVLENTAELRVLRPERLEYNFSMRVTKTVPVILSGTIEPEVNYYISQSTTNPDRVTIYLSKALADSVSFVETMPLDVHHIVDSTTVNVNLKPIRGVNFSQNKVSVTLFADILTEETADVPIQTVNVPEDRQLRLFPSRAKVRYVFGASMFDNVNINEFRVVADYNDIVSGSDKCPINIVETPHGVMKSETELKEVDYLIEY